MKITRTTKGDPSILERQKENLLEYVVRKVKE